MTEVVVGIDFGSSSSGFAFAFCDNKNEIIHGHIYGESADYKVPTEIILDNSNKTVKFGIECKEYMRKRGSKAGHYFKDIKMKLYERKTEIQANNSEKVLPLKLVIQRVLEQLKDFAIGEIKRIRPNIQNNNIKYVVTVPAIWEEYQKNIMMEASINAGLIKEEDDKSLFFALEPEAASYYCLNNKSIDQNLMKEGDFYIICDLGGGTGDIITHLIGVNKNVNEICTPNGGKFGSNEINKLFFEEIIFKIFDCKDFNTYYNKYKEINTNIEDEEALYNDWFDLDKKVMDFKEGTTIQAIKENEYYQFDFGLFKYVFNDKTEINTLVDKYNKEVKDNNLKLEVRNKNRWTIRIPHKIIYNYIKNQVNSICKLIEEILKNDEEEINSIILVGGYCSTELLISEIKKQLSNKITNFFQPPNPCLSIMDGAVLFGLDPNKIKQRIAKYTFGMNANDYWKEEVHSKNGIKYYDEDDKVFRCKDCFSKFITKNQNIELGHEIKKSYTFIGPRYCTMKFYKTNKYDPIFIYEEGIEKIGQLMFDAGKDYPPGERDNIVSIRMGGTFIDVKCKHAKSGKAIKTKLFFD